MTEQQQVILERILRLYPEDKKTGSRGMRHGVYI